MYGDMHKVVLQALLSVGVLPKDELWRLVKVTCDRGQAAELGQDVDGFIRCINQKIKAVSMELKTRRDERTGEMMYALVQNLESEIGKLATDFTENELELFKKIVDKIMTSDSGLAPSVEVLNMADSREDNAEKRLMSKRDADACLKKFVQQEWLHYEKGEGYSLAARSIMELELLLKDKYVDSIMFCWVCKEMVILGQTCDNCGDVKLHNFCAGKFFSDRPNPKCPNERCRADWPHSIDAQTRGDGDGEQSTSSSRKRRAPRLS